MTRNINTTTFLTVMGMISGLTNYLVTAGVKFPSTKGEVGSFVFSLTLLAMGYFAQGIQTQIRQNNDNSLLNALPATTVSPQELARFLEKFSTSLRDAKVLEKESNEATIAESSLLSTPKVKN